jgi:hypothetical protein
LRRLLGQQRMLPAPVWEERARHEQQELQLPELEP